MSGDLTIAEARRLLGVAEAAGERAIRRAYLQRLRALRSEGAEEDSTLNTVRARLAQAYETLGGTPAPAASAIRGKADPVAGRPERVPKDPREISLSKQALVALTLIGVAFAMMIGYMEKRQCNPPRVWDGYQFRTNCYSDVLPLYGARGEPFHVAGKRTSFAEHGLSYRDNNLEYPALTGLLISAVNAPVKERNPAGFLSANAFGLSLFALAGGAALALIARRPKRLMLYAFAPAMFAYAFHNWDLIAVGLMAMGLWAFTRGKDGLAGAMIGLGAAAKVFPGLALPALALARRREGKPIGSLVSSTILWFAVPNIIVLAYAGLDGWWFPWGFQSRRLPNFETLSYFVLHHGQSWFKSLGNDFWFGGDYSRLAQAISTALFLIGSAVLVWRESKQPKFRPISTAFGIVLIFLMTAKVFSPQYAVWLLPFFVLVSVPWHAFAAYAVTDLLVLTAIWAYFTAVGDKSNANWHFAFLETTVYLRYAALGYVLYWTRKGEDLAGDPAPPRTGPASREWVEPAVTPAVTP